MYSCGGPLSRDRTPPRPSRQLVVQKRETKAHKAEKYAGILGIHGPELQAGFFNSKCFSFTAESLVTGAL